MLLSLHLKKKKKKKKKEEHLLTPLLSSFFSRSLVSSVGKTSGPSSVVCSGRGFCSSEGKCSCYVGFSGNDCSVSKKCHDDCNSHGVCFNGRCFCDPGFAAEYCEKLEPCPGKPSQCSDRGLCINGMCVCEPGFGGLDCATVELGADLCPTSDPSVRFL
jgi:hypothetical protein